MSELAEVAGLSLLEGKMVAELRPQGADKGAAIRAMMAEPPFAGARPLVMGDDVTDEDGFRAAAEMGGAGILVGPPRPTAAAWRLEDVAAATRWLERAAEG
jgi:trehalose 6-phosphate phosphatase